MANGFPQSSGKVYRPQVFKGFIASMPIVFLVLIFTIIPFGVTLFSFPDFMGFFPFFGILGIFVIVFVYYYFSLRVQFYELRPDGIFVRKGLIEKTQVLIPYSQIQDIHEVQGLIQGWFGIKTLTIMTMSQIGSVTLQHLDVGEATEIKGIVTSVMNRLKMRDQTQMQPTAMIPAPTEMSMRLPEKTQYDVHILKRGMVNVVALILLFAGAFVLTSLLNMTEIFFESTIMLGLAVVVTFGQAIIRKISFRFGIGANYITIGTDFLGKNFVNYPYEKIQDISLSRDLFDRMLGLSDVVVETGEPPLVTTNRRQMPLNCIPSLEIGDAEDIKRMILNKIGHGDLATADLRERFPLQSVKILKKSISTTVLVTIASAIIIATSSFLATTIPDLDFLLNPILQDFLIILPAAVFFLKLFYEAAYFRNYDYSDNGEILVFRKGVFTIKDVTVSYEKIQNVFVDRDVFDRIFGLYDVHLSTVGMISQMQLHVDGINERDAGGLRDFFLSRVKARQA